MKSLIHGEIKPVSVTQSSTFVYDETSYVARNAIDGDMHTQARTATQSDAWFKATLDREYCITTVVQYWYFNNNTYTCSQDTCSCEGGLCYLNSLSVYRKDGTVPGPDVPSGCKLGDTIKIEGKAGRRFVYVNELVIIPITVGRSMR